MAEAKRRYTDDVPADVEIRLRDLPRAARRVRRAGMGGDPVDGPEADVRPCTRHRRWYARPIGRALVPSAGEELEALRDAGHPFFLLGWGRDAIGMVLDGETDWDEVRGC